MKLHHRFHMQQYRTCQGRIRNSQHLQQPRPAPAAFSVARLCVRTPSTSSHLPQAQTFLGSLASMSNGGPAVCLNVKQAKAVKPPTFYSRQDLKGWWRYTVLACYNSGPAAECVAISGGL